MSLAIWLLDNWQALGSALALVLVASRGLVIALRALVKLTPTPRDDSALEWVVAGLESLIALFKALGLVLPDPVPVDPNNPIPVPNPETGTVRKILRRLLGLGD